MTTFLVAIADPSAPQPVLDRAIQVASAAGASLRILHAAPADKYGERLKQARMDLQHAMEEAMARLPAPLPAWSVRVSGCAPGIIIEEARKIDAALIVLGGHGEPRLRDAIFGTTATHVVRHCERPVLVVQTEAVKPYTRVLLAVEDTGTLGPVLTAACALAPTAELFGVHAFEARLGQFFAGEDALEGEMDRIERTIELAFAEAVAGRPKRVSTKRHAVVEAGDVLSVLMKETEALKPDLVVMGTHRHSGFLSSYSVDTLFWCTQDLLIVPEHSAEKAEQLSVAHARAT